MGPPSSLPGSVTISAWKASFTPVSASPCCAVTPLSARLLFLPELHERMTHPPLLAQHSSSLWHTISTQCICLKGRNDVP